MKSLLTYSDNISYPLLADADTGIYPHAASQYHAGPKAKRGIAMLSVDKFPYPRKQTRGNEFIPCSNNICDILKRFRSFKITAITLIWPKSLYKHQCLPFYIINEVGHLTTSVDHLAEFCQNYHLAAICTQLMVKFFLQLRFIQYFDYKCMKIPDFSRID